MWVVQGNCCRLAREQHYLLRSPSRFERGLGKVVEGRVVGPCQPAWVHVGQRWAVALASINSCANGCDRGAVMPLRYFLPEISIRSR